MIGDRIRLKIGDTLAVPPTANKPCDGAGRRVIDRSIKSGVIAQCWQGQANSTSGLAGPRLAPNLALSACQASGDRSNNRVRDGTPMFGTHSEENALRIVAGGTGGGPQPSRPGRFFQLDFSRSNFRHSMSDPPNAIPARNVFLVAGSDVGEGESKTK